MLLVAYCVFIVVCCCFEFVVGRVIFVLLFVIFLFFCFVLVVWHLMSSEFLLFELGCCLFVVCYLFGVLWCLL